MPRASGWAIISIALLAGYRCAHRPAPRPEVPEGPFRLGLEDVVEIAVWREADLSRTLPVRPDGFISLPIAGEVEAAGKTSSELAAEIQRKLAAYVESPSVTVIVREVNSSRIYVTGEVAHPGAYPVRGRVSLLQAIALAGGLTDFADRDGIVILRQGQVSGRIPVRYRDLLSDEGGSADVLLRPGDTVVVP